MTSAREPKPEAPLEDLVDGVDKGDRPSITEVNGTVARFEMAFDPNEKQRFAFGPPLSQRLGSYVYLALTVGLALVVFGSRLSGGEGAIASWVRSRPDAAPLTFIILLTAIGTVVRSMLRGVVVTRDGIEARYLLPFGVPRIRKWTWTQIDRFVLDDTAVMLELWNGTYERLPKVRDGKALAELLERVAASRGRPVTRLAPAR